MLVFGAAITLACEGPSVSAAPGARSAAEGAISKARAIEGLDSYAVWRDGEWLVEEYFRGAANDLPDIRSGTKSVTSLLVGIALDRGHFTSLDQTLGELAPDLVARHGSEKGAIRLRELLTMTVGIPWDESADQFNAWVVSRDPIGYYLGRDLEMAPGETFAYASPASQLLGELIERTSGEKLADFAREHLFEPLGVERIRWQRLRTGSPNAASGFHIRTRDLVRLGRLVLQNGLWEGRRVVSEEWIELSTRRWVDAIEEGDYGFHWWLPDLVPERSILALGFAGQVMLIVPKTGAVGVATSRLSGYPRGTASEQGSQVMRFMILSEESRALLYGAPQRVDRDSA